MTDVDLGLFFARVQASGVATAIAQSLLLTAGLSALHLVGFTLLMGSAVVANLRLVGALFPDRPVLEVAGPAARGLAGGLAISVTTGVLLFAARASTAYANSTFQLKMALLVAAALFQFGLHGRVTRRPTATRGLLRATGAAGLLLWFGVALAGCAFILLE